MTLKFIAANWGLKPITTRSHDNLPNPKVGDKPYVPVNSPGAVGEMMDMVNFDKYVADEWRPTPGVRAE